MRSTQSKDLRLPFATSDRHSPMEMAGFSISSPRSLQATCSIFATRTTHDAYVDPDLSVSCPPAFWVRAWRPCALWWAEHVLDASDDHAPLPVHAWRALRASGESSSPHVWRAPP